MKENHQPLSLTGIKPTGVPHLGNLVGAILPAIELAGKYDACYFIADYHALTNLRDPDLLRHYTHSVAATWIACGLDPERVTFYRQSDLPETFELAWILSTLTAKGLMNRAHAYKAAREINRSDGKPDLDDGINMGLYNYPILMAADILIMNANVVPVGRDQIQHVEYARDIAERFNLTFGGAFSFNLPQQVTADDSSENTLPGIDGRKMSKSYGNTIPLFSDDRDLRRMIKRITTDSASVEEPKDPDSSPLFNIYRQFASVGNQDEVRNRLAQGGLGWGEMKDLVYEQLNTALKAPRGRYTELMENPDELDELLSLGAQKARLRAQRVLQSVRASVGIQ